jgi:hypothetical protein
MSKKAYCVHNIIYLALRAHFLEFLVMRDVLSSSTVFFAADILAVIVGAEALPPPQGPT